MSHACRFFVEPATRTYLRAILPSAFPELVGRKLTFTYLVCTVTYVYTWSAPRHELDGLLIYGLGRYYR